MLLASRPRKSSGVELVSGGSVGDFTGDAALETTNGIRRVFSTCHRSDTSSGWCMDVTPLVRMLTLFLTQHFADLVPRKSDASICFSGGSAGDSTRDAAPQAPLAHVTGTTPYLVVISGSFVGVPLIANQRTPLTATAFGGLSLACCESHPGRFDTTNLSILIC